MEYGKLAPRQAEALSHRAHGLSNAETAQAMRCSVANVANLLTECFFKLHARNSTEAVAKAVKHGLIHIMLLAFVLAGARPDAAQLLRPRPQGRPATQNLRIRNREYLV